MSGTWGGAWQELCCRGLRILEVRALDGLPWVVHAFSTRPGGQSVLDGQRVLNLGFTDWDTRARVLANRERFLAAVGAAHWPLPALRQAHSDVVQAVASAPAEARRGDALVTCTPGLLLGVRTADCVPILLADTKRYAVAAVHAGWRGTLQRIALKTVGRLRMSFGTQPADLLAVIGPAIGRCCYEVGPEVAQAFSAQFACAANWFDELRTGMEPDPPQWLSMAPPGHQPPPKKVRLDLRAANRWQLLEAGVVERNIFTSELCTACRTDLLFSYRKEGPSTGRHLAVIGIRGDRQMVRP
jgi:hypothetical protein